MAFVTSDQRSLADLSEVVAAVQRTREHQLQPGAPQQATEGFFGRIKSSLPHPSYTRRFLYTVEEVVLTLDTYSWELRTPEAITGEAINLLEGSNPDCGVAASGVDNSSADYPDGYRLQPLAVGAVVWCRPAVDVTGARFFWFQVINTDWGPCEGERECV